jgi:hypothetical protein
MIGGDGPQEPRAEIIEIANRPLPPKAGARRDSERPGPQGRGGVSLGRHRTAISVAAIGLLAGLALVLGGPLVLGGTHQKETALPAIFPATVGGLTVIDVAAASLRETGSADPTELAVGGWYSEVRNAGPCYPADPLGSPCPLTMTATLRSTADPTFATDGTPLPDETEASALEPVFVDPVAPPDLPAAADGSVRLVQPTPLVLIGHFHDDRAGTCPAGAAQSVVCGPAFVVDGLADLAGVVRTPGPMTIPGIRLSSTSVVASIRGQLQPGAYILEFGPVDWLANPASFSPAEYSPDAPLFPGPTVWLIRGYLNGLASWMAIDDASEQAWGPLARPALANPLAAGIPRVIEGLQVQSVASAVRIRAGCCQLVAVGGYLSSDGAPEGCPPAPIAGTACDDTQLVLIDQPGTILLANDQTFTYDLVTPPGDPSIAPTFVPGTGIPDPWADAATLAARLGPREVILIGAFGDPRGPGCPDPGSPGACDQSFVVDQVAWIEGAAEGPSVAIEPGIHPVRTAQEIAQLAVRDEKAIATTTVVSMIATQRKTSDAVAGITTGDKSNGDEVVWVVRVVVTVKGAAPESQFLAFDDQTASLDLTG